MPFECRSVANSIKHLSIIEASLDRKVFFLWTNEPLLRSAVRTGADAVIQSGRC